MKIALFTDTYFPQINGVATSTKILASELRKKGHKVYIFTTTDPNVKTPEFGVFRLPSVAFIFLKSHRASVMYSPKALAAIKKMNIDIVHTQTEFSLGVFGKIAAIRLKKPHVHTFHTMYPDYVHYIANGHLVTPKMANTFCRFCCNVSKVVIVPTEKVKSFLLQVGVKKEIKIIPTGMDLGAFSTERFTKDEIKTVRAELGIKEDDKVIVMVGRVAKEKSMDVIIKQMPEIIKRVPNVKIVIVGDGPVKKELEDLADKLFIKDIVIFAGAKPWSSIGLYYMIGDVFASASVSETQGLTFIEAMAAEVAVVAKYDPCLDGLIEHNETGFIFKDDNSLPDVLYEALTNTELLFKVKENAKGKIQKYKAEAFADSVLEVYESVLSSINNRPKRSIIKKPSLSVFNKSIKLKFFKKH